MAFGYICPGLGRLNRLFCSDPGSTDVDAGPKAAVPRTMTCMSANVLAQVRSAVSICRTVVGPVNAYRCSVGTVAWRRLVSLRTLQRARADPDAEGIDGAHQARVWLQRYDYASGRRVGSVPVTGPAQGRGRSSEQRIRVGLRPGGHSRGRPGAQLRGALARAQSGIGA